MDGLMEDGVWGRNISGHVSCVAGAWYHSTLTKWCMARDEGELVLIVSDV
jgi:hypothetical protein